VPDLGFFEPPDPGQASLEADGIPRAMPRPTAARWVVSLRHYTVQRQESDPLVRHRPVHRKVSAEVHCSIHLPGIAEEPVEDGSRVRVLRKHLECRPNGVSAVNRNKDGLTRAAPEDLGEHLPLTLEVFSATVESDLANQRESLGKIGEPPEVELAESVSIGWMKTATPHERGIAVVRCVAGLRERPGHREDDRALETAYLCRAHIRGDVGVAVEGR
jgi:hypothetical protein